MTLEELRPSVSDNVMHIVRSSFNDVKTACAAGGIKVPTDLCGVLLLTCQGVQAIIDFRSRDASRVAALSKKDDALRWLEAIGD